MLLALASGAGKIDTALVSGALPRLHQATYFITRLTVRNTGNGKAINVKIHPPSDYRSQEPFSVESGGTTHKDFQTERGLAVPRLGGDFSVDWDKDKAVNTALLKTIVAILILFWTLAVAGDFVFARNRAIGELRVT